MLLGYELAFAEINAGGANAQAWGLKGKGVLGKQVRYGVADSELKPNVAVQAQTQFIQRDKAIMITGCVSSASAVALEELAQREQVLNMVGAVRLQRHHRARLPALRIPLPALGLHGLQGARAGGGASITGAERRPPTWCRTTTTAIRCSARSASSPSQHGWTIAAQQVVPLSATDYSSALLNIANSGADIFVNIAFGAEAVASTKQAAAVRRAARR